jgi:hypothetical protein
MNNRVHKLLLAVLGATLAASAFGQNVFPSTGNVGIGTNSPGAPLQIFGGTLGVTQGSATPLLILDNYNANRNIFKISQIRNPLVTGQAGGGWDSATTRIQTITDISPQGYIDFNPANNGAWGLAFGSGGSEFMRISGVGNIGIGTTTPTYHLQVESALDNQFQIRGKGTGFGGSLLASIYSERTTAAPATDRLLQVGSAYSPNIFGVFGSGNVGIGTNSPGAPLQIFGGTLGVTQGSAVPLLILDNYNAAHNILKISQIRNPLVTGQAGGGWDSATTRIQTITDVSPQGYIDFNPANGGAWGLSFGSGGTEFMRLLNGNVGIGTTNPTNKLEVNGTIRAKEVIVETTGWSDYVFAPGYKLAPLSEVETHIATNGHLPGIPSAAEVAEKGVSVGDMQAKLLAKVEELTLHMIAMQKEIAQLKSENAALKTK